MMYEPLSEHFNRREFRCRGSEKGACNCGGSAPIDRGLVRQLEKLRSRLGDKPIKVSSGFRCLVYNRYIGSNDSSQHPRGTAADILHGGRNMDDMERECKRLFHIVIRYSWGFHVDVR